jgi:hypothetical protein
LSAQLRTFHKGQVAYHRRMAREHARHGHEDAAQRHQQAADAHEVAVAAPLDQRAVRAAMRLAAMADEASQRAGVRPLMPWPGKQARHR